MAVRVLDFADGFESSSAPTETSSALNVFVDDAAFVTAKGSAAAEGDQYWNSTVDRIRVFDGTGWVQVPTTTDFDEAAEISYNPAGSTTPLVATDVKAALDELDANHNTHTTDATIHFTEASIDHTAISNIGTNSHATIDTHLASTANPHSVDIDDVTPTTTKGDVIVENGTNAVRLPVGSNGQVLTADSAEATGVKWAAAAGGGGGGLISNLGMTLSAGTFTVTSADGTALSSGNAGTVQCQSVTNGQVVTLSVEANKLFEDNAGTSDINGEEFGTTSAVAWAEDRPFYLYLVNEDDTTGGVEFAISPNPTRKSSPATANIGYHGNPAATPSDENFFFLTATDVTATHNNKPCRLIGGFRMQKTAGDDWTVQSLNKELGDGIRIDPFVGTPFNFPLGQMGAASSNYFINTGSTPPSWATPASIVYKYKLGLDGDCYVELNTEFGGNCTNGGGANQAAFALPYEFQGTVSQQFPAGQYFVSGAPAGSSGILIVVMGTGNRTQASIDDYTTANIDNNDFSSTANDVRVLFRYNAFED